MFHFCQKCFILCLLLMFGQYNVSEAASRSTFAPIQVGWRSATRKLRKFRGPEDRNTPDSPSLVTHSRFSPSTKLQTVSPAASKQRTQKVTSLTFGETMICGALSRTIAQTLLHPANCLKTILQSQSNPPPLHTLIRPSNFRRLTLGAGANFLLSMPHGAINFSVLEGLRGALLRQYSTAWRPGLDLLSSMGSTICCSVISAPQMVVTDNIMAGNYPNLVTAISQVAQTRGIMGFYRGWGSGLTSKLPSYALTWTLFQSLQRRFQPTQDWHHTALGCLASATSVCIMIPLDACKTRLVTSTGQTNFLKVARTIYTQEGMGAFYRGLPPRLFSVVPMIGIQFGVYEAAKRIMLERRSRMMIQDMEFAEMASEASVKSKGKDKEVVAIQT